MCTLIHCCSKEGGVIHNTGRRISSNRTVMGSSKIFSNSLRNPRTAGVIYPGTSASSTFGGVPKRMPDSSPNRFAASGSLVSSWKDNSACSKVRRSEEHTSELQSRGHLVCRLLLEKKNTIPRGTTSVYTYIVLRHIE